MVKSKFLEDLPQYHFERDEFVRIFKEVFGSWERVEDVEVACQGNECLDEFHLYYDSDEFYIIHLPSGTIINWYKHLGRTNTCNKPGFTTDDLRELLSRLQEELFKQ